MELADTIALDTVRNEVEFSLPSGVVTINDPKLVLWAYVLRSLGASIFDPVPEVEESEKPPKTPEPDGKPGDKDKPLDPVNPGPLVDSFGLPIDPINGGEVIDTQNPSVPVE